MTEGKAAATPSASTRQLWRFLAVGAVLLALVFPFLRATANDRNHTLDFATYFTAGKIVRQDRSAALYNLDLQRRVQQRFANAFLPYLHPPFEALVFAVLAGFSYSNALLIWDALNLLVWALAAWQLHATGCRLTRFGQALWWSLNLLFIFAVVMLGQDSLLLFPVYLFAFLALKRKREYAAGIWLGAGLFRFEILVPFAFLFLLRRRWKVLAGLLGMAVLWAGISLAMIGWQGVAGYVELLARVGQPTGGHMSGMHISSMPTLRGLLVTAFAGVFPSRLLFAIVLAASLALLIWAGWEFRGVRRPDGEAFNLEFSLSTIAALLASYHSFVHELTPLIPVAFLLLGYEGIRPRMGVIANRSATLLLLLFTMIFGIGWLVLGFHAFSIEALILLGLLVWLARESAKLRKIASAAGGDSRPPFEPA